MLLNEKLLGYYLLKKPNVIQSDKVINDLYLIVENEWKSKIKEGITNEDLKKYIDECFNYWNLFVIELYKINLRFANLCYNNSYKSQFMANKEMKRIYEEL